MTATTAPSAKPTTTAKPLFKHQKQSLSVLAKNKRVLDTSDPGTGKTRVEVEDFAARRRKGGGCALVLATKSLLDTAWRLDFNEFAPDMGIVTAYATNREEAFAAKADVYVTNHDAVNWLVKQPDSFFKKFDTLIIDEGTAFKHHTAMRSKSLAKIVKHFEYRRILTGTPNTNGILDLWHLLFLLDDGARLGKSFYAFRSAACIPVQVGSSTKAIKWQDRPGIEATIATLIRDITIRHRFEDCVDIPENFRHAKRFKLSKAHMQAYQDMEDFRIVQLRKSRITAINAATVAGKLLQIASGAVYNDDDEYSLINSQRYQLVLDLVEERAHSIVFFQWKHQRDELIKEANNRGVTYAVFDGSVRDTDRAGIIADFQAGKFQVLFAHPKTAGHGLTLIRGTATIWAGPTYNLEYFLQGLKRIHRIGQRQRTETIVVVAEDTIDERVWQVLQNKDVSMGMLLDCLMP